MTIRKTTAAGFAVAVSGAVMLSVAPALAGGGSGGKGSDYYGGGYGYGHGGHGAPTVPRQPPTANPPGPGGSQTSKCQPNGEGCTKQR